MGFKARYASLAARVGTSEPATVPVRKHAYDGEPNATRYDASRSSPKEREHGRNYSCGKCYPAGGRAKALCNAPDGYSR
jgi:hypothetical protein